MVLICLVEKLFDHFDLVIEYLISADVHFESDEHCQNAGHEQMNFLPLVQKGGAKNEQTKIWQRPS